MPSTKVHCVRERTALIGGGEEVWATTAVVKISTKTARGAPGKKDPGVDLPIRTIDLKKSLSKNIAFFRLVNHHLCIIFKEQSIFHHCLRRCTHTINILLVASIPFLDRWPWIMHSFSLRGRSCERYIAAVERTELSLTKSALLNIPSHISSQGSLLKRTMNSTSFVAIGIQRGKDSLGRSNNHRRLRGRNSGHIVCVEFLSKLIDEIGIQNIMRKRFSRDSWKGGQHVGGRSQCPSTKRWIHAVWRQRTVENPFLKSLQ